MGPELLPVRKTVAARITLGFGVADLIRLPMEFLTVHEGGAYPTIVVLDAVNAALLIAAGLSLPRNRRWGWDTTMTAWGAVIGNALVVSLGVLRKVLDDLVGGYAANLLPFTPRLAFYAAALSASPYALWAVWRKVEESASERRRAMGVLATAAFLSGGLSFLVLRSHA